jgi:hypothetical protein
MVADEMVVPSGAALLTASMPMFPPAPVLFSTTQLPPILSCRRWDSVRVSTSEAPPEENGTMTLTDEVPGQLVCACAKTPVAMLATTMVDLRRK